MVWVCCCSVVCLWMRAFAVQEAFELIIFEDRPPYFMLGTSTSSSCLCIYPCGIILSVAYTWPNSGFRSDKLSCLDSGSKIVKALSVYSGFACKFIVLMNDCCVSSPSDLLT